MRTGTVPSGTGADRIVTPPAHGSLLRSSATAFGSCIDTQLKLGIELAHRAEQLAAGHLPASPVGPQEEQIYTYSAYFPERHGRATPLRKA